MMNLGYQPRNYDNNFYNPQYNAHSFGVLSSSDFGGYRAAPHHHLNPYEERHHFGTNSFAPK
jgi:hypothetical protein